MRREKERELLLKISSARGKASAHQPLTVAEPFHLRTDTRVKDPKPSEEFHSLTELSQNILTREKKIPQLVPHPPSGPVVVR